MRRYITIATITTTVVLGTRPALASGGSGDIFSQITEIINKSANASVVLAMAILGIALGVAVFTFIQK